MSKVFVKCGTIAAIVLCLAGCHATPQTVRPQPTEASKPEVVTSPSSARKYTARVILSFPTTVDVRIVGKLIQSVEAQQAFVEDTKEAMRRANSVRIVDEDSHNSRWVFSITSTMESPQEAIEAVEAVTSYIETTVNELIFSQYRKRHPGLEQLADIDPLQEQYNAVNKKLVDELLAIGYTTNSGFGGYDALAEDLGEAQDDVARYQRALQTDILAQAEIKAELDATEARLAKDADSAREAEENDPITKELETLVALAERDYTRIANLAEAGKATQEELDQKQKLGTESRLALLRRREELAAKLARPDFNALKTRLLDGEVRSAIIGARIDAAREDLPEAEARVKKLAAAHTRHAAAYMQLRQISEKLRTATAWASEEKVVIIQPPTLVAESQAAE